MMHGAGHPMAGAEYRPDPVAATGAGDGVLGVMQHGPVEILPAMEMGAGISGQRRLGQVHDIGAGIGGASDQGTDPRGIGQDVAGDGELAGRDGQSRRRHRMAAP